MLLPDYILDWPLRDIVLMTIMSWIGLIGELTITLWA